MTIKTRFAPSPTGYLHIGGARTALFSWLYARHYGGQFILRIEDTDLERSTQQSIEAILQGMHWLGLDYDAGPYYQTQHFKRYNTVIDQLIEQGLAYRCTCSKARLDQLRTDQMAAKQKPRYDGHCRERKINADQPHVVRFRNPEAGKVSFNDLVRGNIQVAQQELDDLILRRTDGTPTYNLTVVVDDHDMGITHVIRGDDHINNTPRQINLYQALGWSVPEFGHLPMILGDDGTRLSKRHGAISVMQYAKNGYLPEALRNYLVRLGWSHGDQELFSTEEMIDLFNLHSVNTAPSRFDREKLNWINRHYLKSTTPKYIAKLLSPHLSSLNITAPVDDKLISVVEAQRERADTLHELAEISAFYYQSEITFAEKATKKAFKGDAAHYLTQVSTKLATLADWQRDKIHQAIAETVTELAIGFGKVAMPLRIAVTGGAPSPELDLTLYLVGKNTVLYRIEKAIQYIQTQHVNT